MVSFVKENFPFGFAKTEKAKATPRVRFEAISVGIAHILRLFYISTKYLESHELLDYKNNCCFSNDLTISDLENIKDEVILFLTGILDGMKNYYDQKLYKLPTT